MIIYGSKSIGNVVKTGKFYCANCRREQNYRLKRYKKYGHIFFIPLFSVENLGDSVECFYCHTSYIPGTVLPPEEYTPEVPKGTVTTQSTIGHTAASFNKRIGAFIIDFIIIYILTSMLFFLKLNALIGIVGLMYFLLCDIYLKGSSVGKLALSMKVSELESEELPSTSNLIIRNVIKSLCGFFPIIYLYAMINEDRQAIHDKIAKTIIIDRIK